MSVWIGSGAASIVSRGPSGSPTLVTPPMSGRVAYPAFMDLIEAAEAATGAKTMLRTASAAIAPRWEELPPACTHSSRADALRFEFGASDDAVIVQEFLALSAARALAVTATDTVFLVRSVQYWDPISLRFLERLARELAPAATLAIELPDHLVSAARFRTLRSLATRIAARAEQSRDEIDPTEGERLLALCPAGLPVETLAKLRVEMPATALSFSWPDAKPAVALPPRRARFVRRTMKKHDRATLHARIFDGFPTDGWNYIRRGIHALGSDRLRCLLRQHSTLLPGLAAIGFDYVYRHLSVLGRRLPGREAFHVHLNAARIAPRLTGRHGIRRAINHYSRAGAVCTTPSERFVVGAELANLLANQRDPSSLRQAGILYDDILPIIDSIGDAQSRQRAMLRWRNGKALVEYHEGNDDVALGLELEALAISEEEAEPAVARWAEPLVRMNTCKLLLKRFGDYEQAVAMIEPLLESQDFETRWNARQNLARIEFDQGKYERVLDLLVLTDGKLPTSHRSEADLLQDTLLISISMVLLGKDRQAQPYLLRAERLAAANDLHDVSALLSDLKGRSGIRVDERSESPAQMVRAVA